MNVTNLLGNMGPVPDKETEEESEEETAQDEEKTEPEIRTIVWCGCGNHTINPKKDPYKQHNMWAAEHHPLDEDGLSDIRKVKGIGASKKAPKPTYDFSGDEFEVTNDILRKHKK